MKKWTKVFAFTFRREISEKAYIATTSIVFFLIAAGIILAFVITAANSDDKDAVSELATDIENVIVVNDSVFSKYDWARLNQYEETYSGIKFGTSPTIEEAVQASESDAHTIILVISGDPGCFNIDVLTSENTAIKAEDAESFGYFLQQYMATVTFELAGLSNEQLMVLAGSNPVVEITNRYADEDSEDYDDLSGLKDILGYAVPYVVIMFLYFLILFYGQGVAGSVLLEKTSKLVDTFLVSVKPSAMIFGKLLAIASAGLMQLGIWVVGGITSFIIGSSLASGIAPGHEFAFVSAIKQFGELHLFTTTSVILAIVIIIAGFLLYCSLSSIGGSLAGKTEDLGTTNSLFSMALVISFLCTLYGSLMTGDIKTVFCYIPFTSVLVVPGWIMLDKISTTTAVISISIVLICTVLIAYFAGKIYKMMSFYKGNPPSLKKVILMLKNK